LLGVSIQDINQQLADEKGLSDLKGVYVAEVIENGSADKAGVKKGDVILSINGAEVNSSSRLQEEIGKSRPGDKLKINLRRKGSAMELEAILLSENGKATVEAATAKTTEKILGMAMENTSREERQQLGLKNGVKVKSLENGTFKDAGIPNDFIITHINNEPVYSVQGATASLKALRGAITIEGKTADGKEKVFAVKMPVDKGED
jgi:S1-C subfamily serine protease